MQPRDGIKALVADRRLNPDLFWNKFTHILKISLDTFLDAFAAFASASPNVPPAPSSSQVHLQHDRMTRTAPPYRIPRSYGPPKATKNTVLQMSMAVQYPAICPPLTMNSLPKCNALQRRTQRNGCTDPIAHRARRPAASVSPEGCASLFVYCTRVLHLSEGATYNRIEVARTARRFPSMLQALEEAR